MGSRRGGEGTAGARDLGVASSRELDTLQEPSIAGRFWTDEFGIRKNLGFCVSGNPGPEMPIDFIDLMRT